MSGLLTASLSFALIAPWLAGETPAEFKTRVDDQVAEWWPKPEEKRFDQIGWAPDLRTARALAAEHRRPIFLFTMDGRVDLGRC
jgi:hypothetical protein